MSKGRKYIAVDLGAESGRVMLGTLTDGRLELAEAHRFANGPVKQGDTLRWDFPAIVGEIKRGIAACAQQGGADFAGLAVNSWGVDFGLLDADGKLIENPYHYRDKRTDGMLDEAFRRMSKRDIYANTGIQFMQFNTLYQVLAMRVANDPALGRARRLVFMADLAAHALSGEIFGEYTLASTSQMMDMRAGKWSAELLKALGLPGDILPPVVRPGTVVGKLGAEVARETGAGALPVIAAASHDTADAVAAVPAKGADWAYLSSGTWSLLGVELKKPVVDDAGFEAGVTNEGGVNNTIRLLKNIMGLWLVQECKRQWQRDGRDFSYAQLTEMAARARPFAVRISPDEGEFLYHGDMPAKINNVLRRTGQAELSDRGEFVRVILESLAFTYRRTLDRIEALTGRKIKTLHIVGGGTQNELLNQFAANATGREVVAGPVEATSIGNVLTQARATGQIRSFAELRSVVRQSFPTKTYWPKEREDWEAEYARREARTS